MYLSRNSSSLCKTKDHVLKARRSHVLMLYVSLQGSHNQDELYLKIKIPAEFFSSKTVSMEESVSEIGDRNLSPFLLVQIYDRFVVQKLLTTDRCFMVHVT